MTIEEIKKLLTEISSWPYEYYHQTDGEGFCSGPSFSYVDKGVFTMNTHDAKFIAQSPQVISDLVSKLETAIEALEFYAGKDFDNTYHGERTLEQALAKIKE
jgi:hypothetical protein